MKKALAVAALFLASLVLITPASAYVGPGAGLSLLGALWALVAALGMAMAFVVAWPVRKMLRARHARNHGGPQSRRAEPHEAHTPDAR